MLYGTFTPEECVQIARDVGRIATALEQIASAFTPAVDATSAPPAQPEVGGVIVAED
jgi:hypothetical protein